MKVVLVIFGLFCFSVSANPFYTKINFGALSKLDKKCNKIMINAYKSRIFKAEQFSLIRFFKKLNKFNCSKSVQFECNKKTFDFSNFTKTVYNHFCKTEKYTFNCDTRLRNLLGLNKTELFKSSLNNPIRNLSLIIENSIEKKGVRDECLKHLLIENLENIKNFEIQEHKQFSYMCIEWELKVMKNNTVLYDTSNLNELV